MPMNHWFLEAYCAPLCFKWYAHSSVITSSTSSLILSTHPSGCSWMAVAIRRDSEGSKTIMLLKVLPDKPTPSSSHLYLVWPRITWRCLTALKRINRWREWNQHGFSYWWAKQYELHCKFHSFRSLVVSFRMFCMRRRTRLLETGER